MTTTNYHPPFLIYLVKRINTHTHTGVLPSSISHCRPPYPTFPVAGISKIHPNRRIKSKIKGLSKMNILDKLSVIQGPSSSENHPNSPSSPNIVDLVKGVREDVTKFGIESACCIENMSFLMSTIESLIRRVERLEARLGVQESQPQRVNGLHSDAIMIYPYGSFQMNMADGFPTYDQGLVNPFAGLSKMVRRSEIEIEYMMVHHNYSNSIIHHPPPPCFNPIETDSFMMEIGEPSTYPGSQMP